MTWLFLNILISYTNTQSKHHEDSSVLKTKLGSRAYFFMNLSNHLSMVFRGTTRIPSDCALSFCKRVIL